MATGSQLDRRDADADRPTGFQVVATALLIFLAGTLNVWAQVETKSSAAGRDRIIDFSMSFHVPTLWSENSELPNDYVHALALGNDGALWVGTEGGGLARYHQGKWQVFNKRNKQLPSDYVTALAFGGDGALWVGTEGEGGGVARYHQGQWQVFNTQNSKLPDSTVRALAFGDGALWVETRGGLARFSPPTTRPIVTQLIGQIETVTQTQHLFSVSVFDPSYLTTPEQLRYQ